ncbi:MAG: hypothetical protein ABS944_15450 [Solibacillus sp.]|jgi:hypothetical protein|uniref:hypothetical protein n=1 Tax=unclassified Solibacillus TaxID=2637870 RepID=UPI0030F5A17F
MLKVDSIVSTPDAYRQHQYYAGTHLVHYPNLSQERTQIIPKFENGIFKRYLEKPNGQRDLISTSTTREKQFLSLRQEHHNREELLQRLSYNNGVHYSAQNSLRHLIG